MGDPAYASRPFDRGRDGFCKQLRGVGMALAAATLLSAVLAAENVVLAGALALMAVLPIAEILLRAAFQVGIPGVASLTQHVVLIAGMLGAAVAARDGLASPVLHRE